MSMVMAESAGLSAAASQIEAVMARMVAVTAAHMAMNAAVLPPGSDLPSVKVAAGLQAHGVQHSTMAAVGNTELARSGMGVAEAAQSYTTGDLQGAAAYTAAGGLAL